MFTLDQINDIHARLGRQANLPDYLKALNAIGVDRYDSFIADGHSEYYGSGSQKVVSPPVHKPFPVAVTSDPAGLLEHLSLHEQGRISYLEMSRGLAASGIEKWTFDTNQMTVAYYDKDGHEMLSESV